MNEGDSIMRDQTETTAVAERGRDRYERELRTELEPTHSGRFVALDVGTGDYEVADTLREASRRLKTRLPDAMVYGVRIGRRTAYRFGGHRQTSAS